MENAPQHTPKLLRQTIVELAHKRGANKSICPSEVARHLAGRDEKVWRLLMKPVRAHAVALADEGKVTITRKGKPVNPHDFRGVYRIRIGGTATEESEN
ncbi:MAG: DUF3253 domain-containing protein [Pseudomonadota bacterium]